MPGPFDLNDAQQRTVDRVVENANDFRLTGMPGGGGRELARGPARPARPEPLRRTFERATVEQANAPTMDLSQIAIGREMGAELGRPAGRGRAIGVRLDQPHGRAMGLIRWGVDGRRPMGEIIRDVASATGAPSGFLERLAQKESAGNHLQTSDTSSARGLMQFTTPTWRQMVAAHGQRYGVPRSMSPEELSDLRDDPRYSAAMAAELSRENAATAEARLGRKPTERDVYAMYFAGTERGLQLIEAAQKQPDTPAFASGIFGRDQVAANQSVFFESRKVPGGGIDYTRPRTLREVYRALTNGFEDAPIAFRARADGSH